MTTASTPRRSASRCHSTTASPTRPAACSASTSSQLPGKRTTPSFTAGGPPPTRSPPRGIQPRVLMESIGLRPLDIDLVVLDQRVREQHAAHRVELAGVLDVELDEPPDVHVAHAAEAERGQRPLDRDPLGVEDAGLGADEH